MDRETEYSLIKRITAGDKEEFRVVVDEYKDLIFSMIMRQTGDRAVAEELTQETFVKAYVNLKSFRAESKLSTWLTRIALNHTNTYFGSRRFKERQRGESFIPDTHDREDRSDEQDELLRKEEELSKFRAALGTLKPKFREVLVLCSLEGKSYEEVAEIVGVPIGTIRSRLNKARLLLKHAVLSGDVEGAVHE